MNDALDEEFGSILLTLIVGKGCMEEGYRKKSITVFRKNFPQLSMLTLDQMKEEFGMYVRRANNTFLMPEVDAGRLKITFTVFQK